jgi:hypothetical protein
MGERVLCVKGPNTVNDVSLGAFLDDSVESRVLRLNQTYIQLVSFDAHGIPQSI